MYHQPVTTVIEKRDGSGAEQQAGALVRAWSAGGRTDTLEAMVDRVGGVDQVGIEERVDRLRKRSIKRESKLWALDLSIRMIDLTTLEGKDTPGKVRALCAKGIHPKPGDPTIPSVAAICIYPSLVAEAKEALAGTNV